jgi:hypothetical protein
VLVFLVGMAAHAPTFLQSFNTDEVAAVPHALED